MKNENKIMDALPLIAVVSLALIFLWATAMNGNKATIETSDADVVFASTKAISTAIPTAEPTATPTATPTEEPLVSMGTFKITAYCACSSCCGKSDGITASGTKATEGRTIAADPSVLPYGTKVIINGHEYTVEDCGGSIKGNSLDVYMESHSEALVHGVQYAEVFVKR